jgi:hypothetical protein
MPRWIPQNQKTILQQIADDICRPDAEREAARRELTPSIQTAPSHRRGRNANAPMSQADEDADLEMALTSRPNDGLTSTDIREIEAAFDPLTRQCLDAIGSNLLLQLFTNNATDVPILISLVRRTGSVLVKTKALDALRLISTRSPIEAAKIDAKNFLTQLEN